MTDEELRKGVIDCMRRAHFMDYAFIHGEEYVKKHRAWIDWEFERKLKQMTHADWERVTKGYVEALKGDKKRTEKRCKFRSQTNCDFCAFHSECDEHWKEGDEK